MHQLRHSKPRTLLLASGLLAAILLVAWVAIPESTTPTKASNEICKNLVDQQVATGCVTKSTTSETTDNTGSGTSTTTTPATTTIAAPAFTSGATTTQAPGATQAPSTTAQSASACSAIISMSQGRQIYSGAPGLEALVGGDWMVAFSSGNGLVRWTNPSLWNNLDVLDRCAPDSEIRLVVFLYDPTDSPGADLAANLDTVKGIVANRYPKAIFIPTLMVGADNHVVCTFGGTNVYSSAGHAARVADALAYPGSGPDLDVPCAGYSDEVGHLTMAGRTDAQADLAAFFGG